MAYHSETKKQFCVPSLAFMLYEHEQYCTSQIIYFSFNRKLPILFARSKCPCRIRLIGHLMFLFGWLVGWLVGWMNAILEQITFTTQRVDAPEVKGYPKFVTS